MSAIEMFYLTRICTQIYNLLQLLPLLRQRVQSSLHSLPCKSGEGMFYFSSPIVIGGGVKFVFTHPVIDTHPGTSCRPSLTMEGILFFPSLITQEREATVHEERVLRLRVRFYSILFHNNYLV